MVLMAAGALPTAGRIGKDRREEPLLQLSIRISQFHTLPFCQNSNNALLTSGAALLQEAFPGRYYSLLA